MLVVSSPINLQGLITYDQYNDLLVQSYVRKFFMTFGLMVVIGLALFLKIFLGAMYSIGYRCSHGKSDSAILKVDQPRVRSKADLYFNEIKGSINNEVSNYVTGMVNNVARTKYTKGF